MNEKENLLKEIETLMSYAPEQKTTINPNYLDYFEIEELRSIRDKLQQKVGRLKEEDVVWLQQFKKDS
jgi:hypothetical protein